MTADAVPPPPPKPLPIPFVSFTVIGLSVLVFAVDVLMPALRLKERLLLFGPAVAQGEWWRPFSMIFVHGNLIHLAFNMMATASLGRDVERGIGSFRFFIASLVGAMGSGVAVMVWSFDQPTVGASGMILAWAGALLPIATQAGRRQLGIWLLQVGIISLLPGVSGAGHVGGFLFGLPCGWAMRRPAAQFRVAAPILVFVAAIALYLAGRGP